MSVVSFLWFWVVNEVACWVVVVCKCGGLVFGPRHRVVVVDMLEVLWELCVVWCLDVMGGLVVWVVVGGVLWMFHNSHSSCAFVGRWFSSGSWHKWGEYG